MAAMKVLAGLFLILKLVDPLHVCQKERTHPLYRHAACSACIGTSVSVAVLELCILGLYLVAVRIVLLELLRLHELHLLIVNIFFDCHGVRLASCTFLVAPAAHRAVLAVFDVKVICLAF